MAIISRITCDVCGKSKNVTHSPSDYPSVCGECVSKEKTAKRAAHLSEVANLTVEERLSRIEAQLYTISQMPEPSRWDERIG